LQYPTAERDWVWQYVFPSYSLSKDLRSGVTHRHHLRESKIQKAVKKAVQLLGVTKWVKRLWSGLKCKTLAF
jgi:hypothetical protein